MPYVSVLRGEVPDSLLRDRLVLVGATAPGLGDRYVTPLSASLGTTPGVEIQANILNGLLQQRTAVDLQPWLAALLSAASVALLLGLMLFRSRHALLLTLACAAWPWVFPGRCCSTAGGGRRWPAWSACCWPT